ncbi:hypothetical protein LLG46_03190 [bacterium]|nr:hypothetical protein [bacterium]
MNIKCCLVSNILAYSERLPAWVRRHIDRCEHCRLEADRYARLRSALKSASADDETCNLSWDQMKGRLLESDTQPASHHWGWAYASAACLCIVIIIGLIALSVYPRNPQDARRVAEVPKSAPTKVASKPMPKPEIVKPDMPKQNLTVAAEQTPKPRQARIRVKRAAVGVVRNRHTPVVKHVRPVVTPSKASDIDKGDSDDPVTLQAKQLQPPEVPSEVSYQAGKLMGQMLISISENVRPELVDRIGDKIKKLVPVDS